MRQPLTCASSQALSLLRTDRINFMSRCSCIDRIRHEDASIRISRDPFRDTYGGYLYSSYNSHL